jgi:hypothetical protein
LRCDPQAERQPMTRSITTTPRTVRYRGLA